ncbi:hypothetical protein LTA6_000029 [Microbacterium sp. LTA6]|uniref:hypothetical protein n=1 Tax=unclassified Microbacterium TaxID=2609290 RepID=UPI0031396827
MHVPKTTFITVAADAVGVVSAVLGGLLAFTPYMAGRWLGLADTSVNGRRTLGAVDLSLGIAIIAGRTTRWRWCAVAVRSLLHLVFAREYARNGRRISAFAMCALFGIDAGITIALRAERRSV